MNITLSDGSSTVSPGVWDLTAQGGANLTVIESGAQLALTGSALQFNISNSAGPLIAALGIGTSLHYGWTARAYFDTSGVLNYQPNTMYNISFNVTGSNGLLGSVLGVTPQFTFELIDGNGVALASQGSGTLINVAGILGTGVTSGTVNLNYMVDGTAPTGPIGVRFTGDTLIGASALGIGTNFATISNLNINATPVPEPSSCLLLGTIGMHFLLRRKRRLTSNLSS